MLENSWIVFGGTCSMMLAVTLYSGLSKRPSIMYWSVVDSSVIPGKFALIILVRRRSCASTYSCGVVPGCMVMSFASAMRAVCEEAFLLSTTFLTAVMRLNGVSSRVFGGSLDEMSRGRLCWMMARSLVC